MTRVGITIGDPSGIGPAITLKAIYELKGLADFVIIGDRWVFNQVSRCQGIKVSRFIDLNNVLRRGFRFGKIKASYGRASVEYLDTALSLFKNKEIDCLVTCPVSKEAVSLTGIKFNGHTEYLAKHTKTEEFGMLLLNKDLKISLITQHIPLKAVASKLKEELIYKNIFLTAASLKKLFLIKRPRLVVCGLNPHASDNGLLGKEENEIIRPIVEKIRNNLKVVIDGPISADAAIYKAKQKEYDCVIAMYHDQALIPLKLCGSDTGVNLTLGLPFIRTSPLHGTAFDIAENPRLARPHSLIEAIRLAVKLCNV
ncbi:MAG: 4-hydroxythreonine-4-phosphate dehydrogenase PdxA [Candidatus Omnitrophota bacterium]|nr:4-hydroxythreonine-4-phosphate dehydrogenase PdxA [Candidatus Omnitrophota bacterium]